MLAGWSKEDPPTMKKLPVEVDVSELLATAGRNTSSILLIAIGDLCLLARIIICCVLGNTPSKGLGMIPNKRSNSKWRMPPSSRRTSKEIKPSTMGCVGRGHHDS